MRIEPKLIDARTEPRLNDNSLVLWLNNNGKTNSMWRDYSGKNNHGTVYGAATPPAATPGALGYTFDGVDDYVDVGNALSLNITQAITISAWIKSTSVTGNAVIVGKSTPTVAEPFYIYTLQRSGTSIKLVLSIGGVRIEKLEGVVSIGTWYYIVGVYNGSYMNIYINGVQNGTAQAQTGSINTNSINVNIGRFLADNSDYFSGSIGEVRIYNRALSQAEITSLFNLERGKYGV